MSSKKAPKKRVRRGTQQALHGLIERWQRMGGRLRKHLARVHAWGVPNEAIPANVNAAMTALARAVEAAKDVPKDWRPAHGTVGNVAIAVGASVELTPRGLKHVDGILNDQQKNSLRVDDIVKGRFVCTTSGGMKFPFHRSHIQLKRGE